MQKKEQKRNGWMDVRSRCYEKIEKMDGTYAESVSETRNSVYAWMDYVQTIRGWMEDMM
jgi:hypothetical protein